MALHESLETFKTVYGLAEGQMEHSSSNVLSEFLPFLFSLSAKDASHLRFYVSDFHSETWQSDFSVSQMKDEVGIGGSLHDFLNYLRTALSSSNVKLVLGLADADGGATTGKVVALKTEGTPSISLPLRKLEGSTAEDAKGSIEFGIWQSMATTSFTPNHVVDVPVT